MLQVIVFTVVLAWVVPRVCCCCRRKRPAMKARSEGDPTAPQLRRGTSPAIASRQPTNWVWVFRVVSMVLFLAYPSVSVKIFRLFNCVRVEGRYYLVADMRQACYDRKWCVRRG